MTSSETNIGILVVHGIGDQKQFTCLKEVAQNIIDFLKSEINEGYIQASITINRATTGTFQSLHPAWQDGEEAPITIHIQRSGKNYNLHLREVWWADLDRPQSIGKVIKFWLWGLMIWRISPQTSHPVINDPENDLLNIDLEERNLGNYRKSTKFEYFLIGLFLIACQPILFFLKLILRLFDVHLPLTILADYVGKLRLYQYPNSFGKGFLEDRNNPPRFSIQRRMINALVRMAISKYDRWYVWSHSLGSIVAYNAFSVPEATLSHYVSKTMWDEIEKLEINNTRSLCFNDVSINFLLLLLNMDCLAGILFLSESPLLHNNFQTNFQYKRPRPRRPVWQKENTRISRKALFGKCRGLLTYGSPFLRIADVWPYLIQINTKPDFHPQFKWYNVLDKNDPVATLIKELFPQGSSNASNNRKPLRPEQDKIYKTSTPFGLSHTTYLSFTGEKSLIGQLFEWVIEEQEMNLESISKREFNKYRSSHLLWWIFLIAITYGILTTTSFVALSALKIIPWGLKYYICTAIGLILLAIVIFSIAWFFFRFYRKPNFRKNLILQYLQDRPHQPFSAEDLASETNIRPEKVRGILEQLTKEKKLVPDYRGLNPTYIFPVYDFSFFCHLLEENHNIRKEKLNRFFTHCRRTEITNLATLQRYIKKYLKLAPDREERRRIGKLKSNGSDEIFFLIPPLLEEICQVNSFPFCPIVTYLISHETHEITIILDSLFVSNSDNEYQNLMNMYQEAINKYEI